MPITLALEISPSLSHHFTWIDWAVLLGYFAVVSALGVVLAGKQQTMQDFFRGGNQLPWYAVTGSMIATIISAVTFIAVPAVVFRENGNFTYLQFGLIAGLLSRLFVAFVLVPAYYKHRVYSPYDYMGKRLGEGARTVTTALFTVLGVLAQAARLYLTAVILGLVLREPLLAVEEATGVDGIIVCIAAIGVISVAWTMVGGIATVVWTDALLFIVFVTGGLTAIAVIVFHLPGGAAQLVSEAHAAGKFQLFNLGLVPDFTTPFTLWAAVFAVTLGNIGSYGTDQLIAQRMFCCRSERDAKLAIIASWAGELVVALMLLVGAGLWVYYKTFPGHLLGEGAAAVAENADNVFPVFILTVVPVGLTGLIIAGIFAAAVSTLTSILAALAQTTLSAVYLPLRAIDPETNTDAATQRELVRASRVLIGFWGVVLCLAAFGVHLYIEGQRAAGVDTRFLDLVLGLASYLIGGLLAAFLLAWLPVGVNALGLMFSAPLSVATVLACAYHEDWTLTTCWIVAGVLCAAWLATVAASPPELRRRRLARTPWLLLGCAAMLLATEHLWFARAGSAGSVTKVSIAWPWYAPVGAAVAFGFGYLLADARRVAAAEPPARAMHEPSAPPAARTDEA